MLYSLVKLSVLVYALSYCLANLYFGLHNMTALPQIWG